MSKLAWGIAIVAILALAFIFMSGSSNPITGRATSIEQVIIRNPQLSVSGLVIDSHFGLSKGCYGTASGAVINNGNGDAYNAIVTCSSSIESRQQILGSIGAHDSRSFSFDIDVSCFKDETIRCRVSCDNC